MADEADGQDGGAEASGADTTPTVTIRLSAALIAGLDRLAQDQKMSRSDVTRQIVEQTLVSQPKGKKGK